MHAPRPQTTGMMRVLEIGGWLLLIGVAATLRIHHFRPLALQFDEVEYAYCAESDLLPHSPYILFMWMGYLLRPFVSLDLGYSLLSLVSSLGSILFFGFLMRTLTRSALGGWIAGWVLALAPVSILFGGRQEVYAFQFLLLSMSWFVGVALQRRFLSGAFAGLALTAHTGTVFALPATLALFYGAWSKEEGENPASEAGESGAGSFLKKDGWIFLVGFLLPILLALIWLFWIWLPYHGAEQLQLLFLYLQGNSPQANLGAVFKSVDDSAGVIPQLSTLNDNLGDQLERIWEDIGSGEVLTRGLALFGVLGLALTPFKKSLAWWLLPIPYLVYEFGVGWTLDVGIYSVFILPSLAAGVAYSFGHLARPLDGNGWTLLKGVTGLGGLFALLINLPALHHLGTYRGLQPWIREEGSTMALAKWVKEYTPPETIVLVPVDWHYCGLAIPYYAGRLPLFSDAYLFNPSPWKPIYSNARFKDLQKITTDDFEKWLDEERPIVCFDPQPFQSFGANWSGVDTDRYEARPLFWLDRNQTGTSLPWKEPDILFHYDPLTSDDPEEDIPSNSIPLPVYERELFRPTLYRIARKSDPQQPPEWTEDPLSSVPEAQWGSAPPIEKGGIVFADEYNFRSPAKPGRDHMVRIAIHSKGMQYAVQCEAKLDGDWTILGRDMEKYVLEPPPVFTELYFHIPGWKVKEDELRLRLTPWFGTPFLNLYEVEVAAVGD